MKVNISGIKDLKDIPDALFVVDVKGEYLAVLEGKKLGIPIIAICDTNVDPTGISYPIPANDDAIKSLKFIISLVSDTIVKNKIKKKAEAEENKEIKSEDEVKPVKNKPKKSEKIIKR